MNEWEALAVGFSIGVLVTSFKDWALIQSLLNRVQFHRPEDYFYAQHIQREFEAQARKKDPFATLRKVFAPTKRDLPDSLAPVMAKDMEKQVENQQADEKEIQEHIKKFEAQRRIQLKQGDM